MPEQHYIQVGGRYQADPGEPGMLASAGYITILDIQVINQIC
jgi:hypothetical protein